MGRTVRSRERTQLRSRSRRDRSSAKIALRVLSSAGEVDRFSDSMARGEGKRVGWLRDVDHKPRPPFSLLRHPAPVRPLAPFAVCSEVVNFMKRGEDWIWKFFLVVRRILRARLTSGAVFH